MSKREKNCFVGGVRLNTSSLVILLMPKNWNKGKLNAITGQKSGRTLGPPEKRKG